MAIAKRETDTAELPDVESKVFASDKFNRELELVENAGIRLFLIRTREQSRAHELLHSFWTNDISSDEPGAAGAVNPFATSVPADQRPVFKSWTLATGFRVYGPITDDKKSREPTTKADAGTIQPSKAIEHAMNPMSGALKSFYLFENMDYAFADPLIGQLLRHLSTAIVENDTSAFFIASELCELPPHLAHLFRIIDLPFPTMDDFAGVFTDMNSQIAEQFDEHEAAKFTADEIMHLTQNAMGMTIREFEHACGMAFARNSIENGEDSSAETLTIQDFGREILAEKMQIIRKTDILELQPAGRMEDVGGLDLAKQYLMELRPAFAPDAREQGIDDPKGVMLVGPPGTGKSLWAKAAASSLNLQLIKFDIGRVFGGLVGQSEARMRQALKLIEAMAPCVVLLDEVDKGFAGMSGGGGGDSGVSQRVFGTFLSWMQDRDALQAPVFVVMTANNVQGLPPELLRKGRLDDIFSVDFPTKSERAAIARIHLDKRGREYTQECIDAIVSHSDRFIGAEIESVVRSAILKAANVEGDQRGILTPQMFIEAADAVIPVSKSWADKIEAMSRWAKDNARPSSMDQQAEDAKAMEARQVRSGPGARIQLSGVRKQPVGSKPLAKPLRNVPGRTEN